MKTVDVVKRCLSRAFVLGGWCAPGDCYVCAGSTRVCY